MINILDKYGAVLPLFDFIELQWNRKYNETGDFELYTYVGCYNPDTKYIQVVGRPETGVVQKVVYEENEHGQFVTVSGFFIDKFLDYGVFTKSSTFTPSLNNVRIMLWQLFKQQNTKLETSITGSKGTAEQFRQSVLYETLVDPNSQWTSKEKISVEPGMRANDILRAILDSTENGLVCKPSFNPNKSGPLLGITVDTLVGLDLRDRVFFGESWNNVSKVEYVLDDSANKNNLIGMQVLPDDVNYSSAISTYVDGEPKKVIYENIVDNVNKPYNLGDCNPPMFYSTNVSEIEAGNESTVRAQMRQQLQLEMLNNYKIETISVDVIQNRFYYGQDYDLGDICTVDIAELNQSWSARITEIHEVYRKNNMEVQLVMGTPQKNRERRSRI